MGGMIFNGYIHSQLLFYQQVCHERKYGLSRLLTALVTYAAWGLPGGPVRLEHVLSMEGESQGAQVSIPDRRTESIFLDTLIRFLRQDRL